METGQPIPDKAVNIADKLALVKGYWAPKIIAAFNGQEVKVAKLKGEFVWHRHENEDELFWVIKGNLVVHFRDRDVEVGGGEIFVIPRGVEHKPEARSEVELVFIDPAGTPNTGNVVTDRTVAKPETS